MLGGWIGASGGRGPSVQIASVSLPTVTWQVPSLRYSQYSGRGTECLNSHHEDKLRYVASQSASRAWVCDLAPYFLTVAHSLF